MDICVLETGSLELNITEGSGHYNYLFGVQESVSLYPRGSWDPGYSQESTDHGPHLFNEQPECVKSHTARGI